MNWPAQDRWQALLRSAGASNPASDWYERLASAYAEPQRHYHNRRHIAECLEQFDQSKQLAQQPVAVELALWFHDAVYDPKAGDNEERSAALAKNCLNECRIAAPLVETVSQLILVTKHHDAGSDADAALMIDVDLSILGRDEKRFFEYEEQIRREYQFVPSVVFRAKRATILMGFLDRERIFVTDWFHGKYEEPARRNLASSIQKLKPRSR